MLSDRYQGFLIEFEVQREPALKKGGPASVCFLSVYPDDGARERLFGIEMFVRDLWAREGLGVSTPDQVNDVSRELGVRWVHGLLDLDRWTASEEWVVERRDREPISTTTPPAVSDEMLRLELLRAMRRMREAEGVVDYALRLDVDGFADVLQVPVERVRRQLSALEGREALRERAREGKVVTGNARLTTRGFELLESLESGIRPDATFSGAVASVSSYVDDADFSLV